jgi:hypothetical protein
MKQRYRVFKRGNGVLYCLDTEKNKQTSLKTRDHGEAQRLVNVWRNAFASDSTNAYFSTKSWLDSAYLIEAQHNFVIAKNKGLGTIY